MHLSPRPRRTIVAILAALACLCVLPSATGALVVGIGDAGIGMFGNPKFLALGVHEARLTVSWNVAVARSRRAELQADSAWLGAAAADHVAPLVSFSGKGNYIPNVRQYGGAVRAFIHRFPKVKRYTAWNEPDWPYRSLSKHPRKAAWFFNALVRSCHHCTVLAGDVYLPTKKDRWSHGLTLGSWVRAYRKGLQFRPAGWALHNYYDIRTHTTNQLQTLMKLTSGPIWLDEISGVERRGHWPYRNQSVNAATRDEQFLFSLAHRFRRISRIYHYQWQANPFVGWDSGLLGPDGTPRPAYYVVQHAAGR